MAINPCYIDSDYDGHIGQFIRFFPPPYFFYDSHFFYHRNLLEFFFLIISWAKNYAWRRVIKNNNRWLNHTNTRNIKKQHECTAIIVHLLRFNSTKLLTVWSIPFFFESVDGWLVSNNWVKLSVYRS